MSTHVIYSNPMNALTTRYAVVRDGVVIDRKSTKKAALRRAVFYCRQNIEERLAMDPNKWPQIVANARQDDAAAKAMEAEIQSFK